MKNYQDICIALAGVCQSAKLVQQFAQRGFADQIALETSLNSLFKMSVTDIMEIYGGDINNLKLGLQTLVDQLQGYNNPETLDLTTYWLGALALEARLRKTPKSKAELAKRIQYLPQQRQYFELLDEGMFNSFASIYTDVISPLGRKIQVKGSVNYLQSAAIQAKIRACLLAAVRSAVLWQQVGGSKWQILFSRKKLINTAQHILSSL